MADQPRADYGPLNSLARGRIDLSKMERHWDDMTRLAGSLHTGAVRAYDTLRVLQRDGKPTALGEAVATYGRIAKTEHMFTVLDDEAYRRQISNQLSIQESRHALARRIFTVNEVSCASDTEKAKKTRSVPSASS